MSLTAPEHAAAILNLIHSVLNDCISKLRIMLQEPKRLCSLFGSCSIIHSLIQLEVYLTLQEIQSSKEPSKSNIFQTTREA